MTDFAAMLKPDRGEPAHPIHVVDSASFNAWARKQGHARQAMLEAIRFDGQTVFEFAILQGRTAADFEVVTCVGDAGKLGPWCLAKLGDSLPAGTYRLDNAEVGVAALGWLLSQHVFERYKTSVEQREPRVLLTDKPATIEPMLRLANASAMVRDMVDTPAADMGPADLEQAVRELAERHRAEVEVTHGDALEQGYPLIAAVGAAAARGREPRLIELRWGSASDPLVAVIGKGVCFDTGGLDIKPGSGMRLMKKDMGGAAHAIALSRLVMESRLPVRLHLLVPAVENSVSGSAMRPGDIVKSRKGMTVEIDNTDAEGRLILADALDKAGEGNPALMLDFATLTGAARIALGPDLPATFVNDDTLAENLLAAAREVDDPLWRMPLWDNYDENLKSDIADFANASDSPMGGAILAALFLRRFVPKGTPWAHLDTFAWHPAARPGRPKGGEALGLRAAFRMLHSKFAND